MEEFIEICFLRTRYERLRLQVIRREAAMTPKFKGVAERLAKLQHNLDHDAGKLMARIDAADTKRETVFAKSNATVDAAHGQLDDIDSFVEELDRANASPSDGLPLRSSTIMKE